MRAVVLLALISITRISSTKLFTCKSKSNLHELISRPALFKPNYTSHHIIPFVLGSKCSRVCSFCISSPVCSIKCRRLCTGASKRIHDYISKAYPILLAPSYWRPHNHPPTYPNSLSLSLSLSLSESETGNAHHGDSSPGPPLLFLHRRWVPLPRAVSTCISNLLPGNAPTIAVQLFIN